MKSLIKGRGSWRNEDVQASIYVYILECSDGTYYTGITNNPNRRLIVYNLGLNTDAYTYSRRPVRLVYCEAFPDYKQAISWEKQIKRWSRRKKEALIREQYHLLPGLSKKQFEKITVSSSSPEGTYRELNSKVPSRYASLHSATRSDRVNIADKDVSPSVVEAPKSSENFKENIVETYRELNSKVPSRYASLHSATRSDRFGSMEKDVRPSIVEASNSSENFKENIVETYREPDYVAITRYASLHSATRSDRFGSMEKDVRPSIVEALCTNVISKWNDK